MFPFVGFLVLLVLGFVLLVERLEPGFGRLVDSPPALTDDLGELGNFGAWVFRLHIVIDFPPKEEESGERLFRRCRLNKRTLTLDSLSFLPILYRTAIQRPFVLSECITNS